MSCVPLVIASGGPSLGDKVEQLSKEVQHIRREQTRMKVSQERQMADSCLVAHFGDLAEEHKLQSDWWSEEQDKLFASGESPVQRDGESDEEFDRRRILSHPSAMTKGHFLLINVFVMLQKRHLQWLRDGKSGVVPGAALEMQLKVVFDKYEWAKSQVV